MAFLGLPGPKIIIAQGRGGEGVGWWLLAAMVPGVTLLFRCSSSSVSQIGSIGSLRYEWPSLSFLLATEGPVGSGTSGGCTSVGAREAPLAGCARAVQGLSWRQWTHGHHAGPLPVATEPRTGAPHSSGEHTHRAPHSGGGAHTGLPIWWRWIRPAAMDPATNDVDPASAGRSGSLDFGSRCYRVDGGYDDTALQQLELFVLPQYFLVVCVVVACRSPVCRHVLGGVSAAFHERLGGNVVLGL